MNTSRTRGFTLIELLVVIAIIGILSSVVLASLSSARQKARDAQRLSDMREMSKVIALTHGTAATTFTGCVLQNGRPSSPACTGSFAQLALYKDPSGATTACTAASVAGTACDYSISKAAGGAGAASNEDYQIKFNLEVGAGSLPAGLNCIVGPSGSLKSGAANCP